MEEGQREIFYGSLPPTADNRREQAELIGDLAEAISRRGLAVPAILLLELYKPLVSILHSTAVVTFPVLAFLAGSSAAQNAAGLLQSRENVEALMRQIEALEQKEREAA